MEEREGGLKQDEDGLGEERDGMERYMYVDVRLCEAWIVFGVEKGFVFFSCGVPGGESLSDLL